MSKKKVKKKKVKKKAPKKKDLDTLGKLVKGTLKELGVSKTIKDDTRDCCKFCNRKIRWSELAKKWFHLHNFTTLCTGMALSPNRAVPKKDYSYPK